MRRSSGETILLVVPGGEGTGGKEEEGAVHKRAGAQAHRARSAGLSGVLFVKEEEEEEEGKKKLPKLRASSSRGSCWSSSTTGTLLGVGSSHRRPCVSVWATSPRALRHVAECLPHVAFGFKDAATDSELTARQVRRQYCAERRSTMASLPLVMALVCPLPCAELDHGVLVVGHGLQRY